MDGQIIVFAVREFIREAGYVGTFILLGFVCYRLGEMNKTIIAYGHKFDKFKDTAYDNFVSSKTCDLTREACKKG